MTTQLQPAAKAPVKRLRLPLHWLGVLPFAAFVVLFMVLPTLKIVVGAFQRPDGSISLDNIANLFTPSIMAAYGISIRISVASAFFGCLIGFFVAAAVVLGGLPRWIRGPLLTFSGVASNFAGVPLAFAFLATLGPLGIITVFLQQQFGVSYLLISHDLTVVNHLCDDVCVVLKGRIVEQGPPERLFREAEHPYTRSLLEAVQHAPSGDVLHAA